MAVGALAAAGTALPSATRAQKVTTIDELLRTPPPTALELVPAFGELEWSWFLQSSPGLRDDGVASADAAAGVEVVFAAEECDLFRAGASGRYAFSTDGHAPSGEQWASGCFLAFPFAPLEVGHHFEWNTLPALSAHPYLPPGDLRRERILVGSGLLDISVGKEAERFAAGLFELNAAVIWFRERTDHFIDGNVDFTMIRYARQRRAEARPDLTVDVVAGGVSEIQESDSSSRTETTGTRAGAMRLDAARVRGVEIGPVTLGGSVGFIDGYVRRFRRLPNRLEEDQPPEVALADVQTIAGDLSARVGIGRFQLGLEATRDAYPTGQDEFALDSRVRLSAQGVHDGLHGTAGVFYANTLLAGARGERWSDTGGGDLQLTYFVRPDVSIGLFGEAARSFYADTSDAAATDPKWAFRGRVALTLWNMRLATESR